MGYTGALNHLNLMNDLNLNLMNDLNLNLMNDLNLKTKTVKNSP